MYIDARCDRCSLPIGARILPVDLALHAKLQMISAEGIFHDSPEAFSWPA